MTRKESIELTISEDPQYAGKHISAYVDNTLMDYYGPRMVNSVMVAIADRIADAFMQEHGQEILAKLDPQAIANLAIADSAASVRQSLEKVVTKEVVYREPDIYKVGLFGGVRKLR